ncbi:MAG: MBOAT family protein [Butyrivibrio sp.]|nr:MBOAT family protein [Butyrivibrio sp.]
MELYSIQFFFFIAVLIICYYTFCRKFQWVILLIGSMGYYFFAGGGNLLFILVTAITVWSGGLYISKISSDFVKYKKAHKELTKDQKKTLKNKALLKKRIILLSVLLINFGILAYIKYWNVIFKTSAGLLLPLGISFYTFQSISYLIDMYNEKYPSEKNFFRFLLFVSYFPQLIQGPINRYDKLGVQFNKTHSFDIENSKRALLVILYGLMKKYAIANMLSDSIELIFGGILTDRSGAFFVFGILLYSAQQYADFSGGIDIVMGISELFGISMMKNFRQPYFAVSLGDFWRRWHISLGAWMRDYVFYPFALLKPMQNFGKWCGKIFGTHCKRVLPAGIANILVFFIVGVWHGAEMHYVAWGLYNGIVIAASDLLEPFFKHINAFLHIDSESRYMHIFRILRTFFIVNIGWYFDRIYDISDSFYCLGRTFLHFDITKLIPDLKAVVFNTNLSNPVYVMCGYIIALIAIVFVFTVSFQKENGKDVYLLLQKKNIVIRWSILLLMIFLFLGSFMVSTSTGGFMYANF